MENERTIWQQFKHNRKKRAFQRKAARLQSISAGRRARVGNDAFYLRKISDHVLHERIEEALVGAEVGSARLLALHRELRRREAWAAPAGRAFWISVGALSLSALALAVSAYAAFLKR